MAPLPLAAPALTTPKVDCELGDNKYDNDNGAVLICGANGWLSAEICDGAGACHVESAGNAFCEKKPECVPGTSQCDTAAYVSKVCNDKGISQTDLKCSKPGCCEVQDEMAVCKTECGPGLQPPTTRPVSRTTNDWPKPGDVCKPDGEEYCDYTYSRILECVAIGIFTLKSTCKTAGSCYYNNHSLRPHCR